MDPTSIRSHVTIVAVLFLCSSVLFLMIAAAIFVFFFGIGVIADEPEAFTVLGSLGTIGASVLVAAGLPGLIASFGLFFRKKWSRFVGILVGGLFLIKFPIGTAVGIYAIWVLLSDEARDYLEGPGEVAELAA